MSLRIDTDGDLNKPSAVCIVLESSKKQKTDHKPKDNKDKGPAVKIDLEDDTWKLPAGIIKLDQEKKVATISLSDCLSCSGCITSAETVLITQQSTGEFLSQLGGGRTLI